MQHRMIKPTALICLMVMLSGCSVEDSRTAHVAQTRLMGMSEVGLESCIGAPDQHASFGNVDVLTYYANSTFSDSLAALPLLGGLSYNYGGYCHATFQITNGRVTQILYSGEKNATLAPDAFCAPIVRTCLTHLRKMAHARAAALSSRQSAPK